MNNGDPGPVPPLELTSCLECGKKFKSTVAVPIVGQPGAQYFKFVNDLVNHVTSEHRQLILEYPALQAALGTILLMRHFAIHDPEFLRQLDPVRHQIHDLTRARKVSDETIAAKVSLLALDPEKHASVVALLKEIRDVLEERLGYEQPGSKPVLTV